MITVKERPILFSGPMVRAILEGRKTQTRRVIKLPESRGEWEASTLGGPGVYYKDGTPCNSEDAIIWNTTTGKCMGSPYGMSGDRLWVRETFMRAVPDHIKIGKRIYVYKTDDDADRWSKYWKWSPSIHMPRIASRINLEITNIRVERVQDISRADCEAEGLKLLQGGVRSEFAVLWDSINKARGYGWTKNPWVWVVEFKVIHG